MKLATYNVEWFSNLFDNDGQLYDDDRWSGRRDVTRAAQTAALGHVFKAMDADGIMVIEGPDSHARRDGAAALEGFAARFGLRARRAIIGFVNHTQQEILFLYDPDMMSAEHAPSTLGAPQFDDTIDMDLDSDDLPDGVRWSKPPLELLVTSQDKAFRVIGVHAKSKAPHGARTKDEVMRISIANRRKQLAQCIWLRRRIEAHLAAGDAMIVMGDFNDGPGLDEFEKLFGRSGVEIVLGEGHGEQLYDPHAEMALSRRLGALPATARFKLPPHGRYLSALLDYIMVSQSVRDMGADWTILHPFDHPACFADKPLMEALLTASDHFPVVMTFDA
ncbi:endonuclease/exonuclease/phosphatase family protein [Pseudooctadecabacter jejudonensis]|uniref:Endonuclease/Exonuclease/phosphatase family protein n=1 Tax=Pseudooctadecabacter jejudonensis TaxID=1391910 RepID=A0A1Y5SGH8_9RHOB|nr:endonuclease/exonuclease/phosphatase family protein [Pseudooctadecabacter jejudonensis]SLN39598.1 Endonuclease/Exonuclease/phosphatase family protein [Pseudooctadecabacter jejudonensis]